jgi:hypothetical protein
MRPAFQTAKHDSDPVMGRQPIDLLVDHPFGALLDVVVVEVFQSLSRRTFVRPPAHPGGSIMTRSATGGLVKPGAQEVARPKRPGLASYSEESRLKCVVGLVLVPQDGLTRTEHESPVPLHQGGEGQFPRLARAGNESLE